MKIILPKSNIFAVVVLLLVFSGKVIAQCSISSSISTSSLTCGTSPLNSCGGILYIGNGTDSMTLTMNANLDLTCLGAIRFIVRNGATVDFSTGNYDLTLKEGSSIEIESGGQLGAASNCSASDLIKIGTEKIASCNGGSALMDFPNLVSNGGYSSISASASPSSFCNSGSSIITALANPSSGATYKWYTVSSGGSPVFTGNPFSTGTISATTTYYVEASYTSPTYTTVRKPVTVTVNPLPTITGSLNVCVGSTTTLIGSATANTTTPWTSANTSVATISSSGVVTGVTAGTSLITYMNNNGCAKTATITVNALPDNTSSSGFSGGSFCTGSQASLIFDAADTNGAPPYTLSYTDGTTTFSQNIPTNAATTFNVSATTSKTYTLLSITNANGCVNLSPNNKTASVTFRPSPTASIGGNAAVCLGATSPNITFTNSLAAGITVTYTINGGTNQTVTVGANSTTNISAPTTTPGLFVYALVSVVYSTNPACTQTLTGSATVTVNAMPNTPTIGTAQPTCTIPTGTITITAVAGETYSFDSGAFLSTLVYSGLAQGTSHTVYAKNSSGCISFVANSTINSIVTNTYSGTWSAGSAPTSGTQNIVFNAGYIATTDLSGCSCTVNSGNVTINSGKTLTITNAVTVNTPGTLTFEDSASLVQTSNVANTGNIAYKRNYTGGEFDYTYWSSPVVGQNLLAVSPSTKLDKFFSFDGTDWVQENPATTTMTVGKGYIIRGIAPPPPPAPPPGFSAITFIGVPNNGNKSITVVGGEASNLIGNPYPSAIYADQFLFDNQSVIDGTIYFWTHNTPIAIGTTDSGSGVWAYSGNDYASYSLTGGVGTGTGTFAISGGIKPTGKIAAGQSFFTTSTVAGGTLIFTNAMRIDGSGNSLNNSNFYKTRNTKTKIATSIEKHRVWLDLTNVQGAFKQTLVGYITGATNTWDNLYDGESFDGNDFLDFYSINADKKLTIQGRELPFDENDEIPLGYRVALGGDFTINIDQTDGLLTDQQVFIEDKLTNTIFDLKSGNYTFNTVAGTFNDRFVLRYTDKTLKVNETDKNDGIIVLYSTNYKSLIIRNNLMDATVNSVTLYNTIGQKIAYWEAKVQEQTNIQIPMKNLPPEIYIVKVTTTKGESGKKIIIK
jgi:hypothetical protein